MSLPIDIILSRISERREDIERWLNETERAKELPLYSSVDIRDSGFKAAVVDTNLFPAGFNNLCEHGIEDSVLRIQTAIRNRVNQCRDVLIIAEEHTRNTWYLENVRILKDIIEKAGFNAKVATFLEVQPAMCTDVNYIELETATGQPLRLYCLNKFIQDLKMNLVRVDLIIMNNDLTTGIPEYLKELDIPIYPSLQAGWHSRLKSHHFSHTQELVKEFAEFLDLDPWLFSCLDRVVEDVSINDGIDREKLAEVAEELFKEIEEKYKMHGIDAKPYIFMKADSGTYGMGVLPIEHPDEIRMLNKHGRKKLGKGKSAQTINRFLLQEGVPTRISVDNQPSEVVIYQIENNLVGGFYRMNDSKNDRENLNSSGMGFEKMCPRSDKYCGIHTEANIFDLYRILARIATSAAHREIEHLEEAVKS